MTLGPLCRSCVCDVGLHQFVGGVSREWGGVFPASHSRAVPLLRFFFMRQYFRVGHFFFFLFFFFFFFFFRY